MRPLEAVGSFILANPATTPLEPNLMTASLPTLNVSYRFSSEVVRDILIGVEDVSIAVDPTI